MHPAKPEDVAPFLDLLERAASWLSASGIRQWSPGTMKAQAAKLARMQVAGDLLIARDGTNLLGGMVLTGEPDPLWADAPRENAAYLSKLVIDRAYASRGLGAALLADAERIARIRGYARVRLDCVADNTPMTRYYQALGYYPHGVVPSGGLLLHRHEKELIDVDFDAWHPAQHATLMFVTQLDHVLLIHKKRGHGAGKVNGPGGAVERNESPLEAAVRETREEVGIEVRDARAAAELRFRDPIDPPLCGYVFVASRFDGTPIETEEALPFWCDRAQLPLDRMWADDCLWLPPVLEGLRLIGDFAMSGDAVRAHRLRYVDDLPF